MKKIFTILLIFATIASFGQRSCNLEVTMSSPAGGTTIRKGSPVMVTFTIKNLGPDAIMPGDTVWSFLSVDNIAFSNFTYRITYSANIPANGTAYIFSKSIDFDFNNAVPAANLCGTAIILNRIEGNVQVSDPVTTNNSGCSVVNIRSNDIKVLGKDLAIATDINASPNPANDFVNVSYKLINPETVTVSIYDMNGRLVSEPVTDKQGAGDNSIRVNTSELNAGLYFYEVKIGNQSERYKLMVN